LILINKKIFIQYYYDLTHIWELQALKNRCVYKWSL